VSERLRRRDDVEWVELDGEVVVYDRAGAHLHRLNPTAAAVWRACDGARVDDVVRSLEAHYDADGALIEGEVRTVVREFLAAGLLDVDAP
jgi:hypothetical protein